MSRNDIAGKSSLGLSSTSPFFTYVKCCIIRWMIRTTDNCGSTLGNKPFTISQFANDTAGLLNALKINKKADVLGFSLGSLTARELTLGHPEKVNKLILYASS
ncbi:MAG: alpha/beta hydrolase [Candidatus Nitrosopolaris sp.]